jgi:hypothetical protein
MKTMTCKQLGGACDLAFQGETFEVVAQLSKVHGAAMSHIQDEAHLAAMQAMMGLMKDPQALTDWMKARRQEFDALPDDPADG